MTGATTETQIKACAYLKEKKAGILFGGEGGEHEAPWNREHLRWELVGCVKFIIFKNIFCIIQVEYVHHKKIKLAYKSMKRNVTWNLTTQTNVLTFWSMHFMAVVAQLKVYWRQYFVSALSHYYGINIFSVSLILLWKCTILWGEYFSV